MPKLAAFPKLYMNELCIEGTMTVREWIEKAALLDIDGLEMYAGMIGLRDPNLWPEIRKIAGDHDLLLPMMCASPDFTHPDPLFRQQQVENQKVWIEMTAALGGEYCRVLSGQRRPGVGIEEGLQYAADCIEACLPLAKASGVTLVLENHYKDNYWEFPEFAQAGDVFCELVERIQDPNFGVNYDPSNTLLAGEDPIQLLERVKNRVLTMHASDRYLTEGTLEDLRAEEGTVGYAQRLKHGEIGQGLNDFDAIFSILKGAGFDSWISIEDGVDGFDQLERSVNFLRGKMNQHWN